MTTPESGYPRAAAISPRVQIAETTDSTNADAVAAVQAEPEAWPHLALVVTTDQRHGRGRLDRTWTAPAGTAVAVSVVVRVPELPVAARGWIPLIAGYAMAGAVGEQLGEGGHTVAVKWPNDVLVDGGKICGILAEAVPGHADAVVIGAGVNTRMTAADLPVPTATSFAALGREVDEDRLLADYLRVLDEQLAALAAAGGDAEASGLRHRIQERCATVGARVMVSMPDGSVLTGRADRLDPEGRLVVAEGALETAVGAGDVTHVR
ncbi:biotin--[acetyl-CoA-carboxylase] ligase [Microbacterium sp. SORGH_AS_0888]|uniref:biotin--[acetyl-CoA-carboxylase] ligase n=1 Tax=Microbacterium sp. SORGH_AS_0888 TaxID=3041791 RepID=UPI00278145CE|nr:biotin--[acetyl-CoA-carboxylase] ligase [Microbacterium sp. SORGH_AS_0888]MDQ1131398.1 BirA family biotin operon repressor/biotin-[acetyl-CoA-carboxylase] ligase [Microbacterium sp. SORGH_AS_0888]